MKNILVITLTAIGTIFSQTVYEVQPGTKGNEISITVANISETDQAANVEVILTKKSSSLNFTKEQVTIELIEAKAEAEASFVFDVNRNTPVNKKDTIDFLITSSDGIIMTKSFIFGYIGPKEFKLEQNFPNPFNPTTTIQYQIQASPNPSKGGAFVILKVYDVLGSEVITLVNTEQKPGYYEVQFDGGKIASGIYIYRLISGNYVSTKKMLMIK